MARLSEKHIMTIEVLKERGQSNCEIAQTLGVTEGAVRHHLKRLGTPDGRSNRPHKADSVAAVVGQWMADHGHAEGEPAPERSANLRGLHEFLVQEHGYEGSYRSVLRYVAGRFPKARRRPYRRVEMPPGVQAQVDWVEFKGHDFGLELEKVYGFAMVLSHSRMASVVWSPSMNQLAWQEAHNEAFRRLQGIAAVVRIDNLKTGVAQGAGPHAVLNESYVGYARAVGFHIDPCLVRHPEAKGKVESRVGKFRMLLDGPRRFGSLAELQGWTDERLGAWSRRSTCPATGLTVWESWEKEQPLLRPVGLLPEVFDIAVTRPVHKDCTVNFEGRMYTVPFALAFQQVEVRGCATKVQVLHEGRVQAEFPRRTQERLLIDPAHYEGPSTTEVLAPLPLGRMGQRIMELASEPVQLRAVDYYARLMEVAS